MLALAGQPVLARTIAVRAPGALDSGPVLQRAVDRASAGDTLSLAAGTYRLTTSLRLKSGVRVTGAGPATVLRYAGTGSGVFEGEDVSDIRISDLTILGDGADAQTEEHGGIMVHVTHGQGEVPVDLVVERVRVAGFASSGVAVTATGKAVATGVTIRDCVFEDLQRHGVLGYFVRRYHVERCQFRRMGRAGTIFPRCQDVTVRDCTVRTTGWHGLEVGDETEGFLITGNVVEDSGDHAGILVEQAAHRGVIAHNRIVQPRFQGIQLNNKPAAAAVREVTVTGNLIEMPAGSTKPALLVYGDTTFTVDDCQLRGNTILGGQNGIEAHYLKRCQIADNILRGPGQGLRLVFLNEVMVTGNLLTDCATGGIAVTPYAEIFTNREVTVTNNAIYAAPSDPPPVCGIALSAVRGGLVAGNWVRGFGRDLDTVQCAELAVEAPR
jgi:nitrous oxidase accessory protein NosD